MLEEYRKFFSSIFFPTLDAHGIKTVINLGDTWDIRKDLNLNTLKSAKDMYFDELVKRDITQYMIYGNHDIYFRNTNDVNSVDFLSDIYSNVKVIKDYDVLDFDGCKIGLVSWINNSNYEEYLKWIMNCSCDILGGHFEIQGFEMMRGVVSTHGFTVDQFKRFDNVWSGHFHLQSKSNNIHYLGNPFWTNWGEYDIKKGFHIFDTETRKLTFIENPFNLYVKLTYNNHVDTFDLDLNFVKDKIVKCIVNLSEIEEKSRFEWFIELVQSKSPFSLEVIDISSGLFSEQGEDVDISIDINEYIDKFFDTINVGVLDKDLLRSKFNNLYLTTRNKALV